MPQREPPSVTPAWPEELTPARSEPYQLASAKTTDGTLSWLLTPPNYAFSSTLIMLPYVRKCQICCNTTTLLNASKVLFVRAVMA